MGRQMGEKKGMRGRINHDRINQRGAGGSLGGGGVWGRVDSFMHACMGALWMGMYQAQGLTGRRRLLRVQV